jgi:hypothetical protein
MSHGGRCTLSLDTTQEGTHQRPDHMSHGGRCNKGQETISQRLGKVEIKSWDASTKAKGPRYICWKQRKGQTQHIPGLLWGSAIGLLASGSFQHPLDDRGPGMISAWSTYSLSCPSGFTQVKIHIWLCISQF